MRQKVEEAVEKIKKFKDIWISRAILHLRRAGIPLELKTGNPNIGLVFDNIQITINEDSDDFSVVVDNFDLTPHVRAFHVSVMKNKDPVINVQLLPKSFNIKTNKGTIINPKD